MGVHRITSESAKYYAAREKLVGSGITLLGLASEKVSELNKKDLEAIGDMAAALLPYAPGYAGKLLPVVARVFWNLSGSGEKEFEFIEIDKLEQMVEVLKKKLEE